MRSFTNLALKVYFRGKRSIPNERKRGEARPVDAICLICCDKRGDSPARKSPWEKEVVPLSSVGIGEGITLGRERVLQCSRLKRERKESRESPSSYFRTKHERRKGGLRVILQRGNAAAIAVVVKGRETHYKRYLFSRQRKTEGLSSKKGETRWSSVGRRKKKRKRDLEWKKAPFCLSPVPRRKGASSACLQRRENDGVYRAHERRKGRRRGLPAIRWRVAPPSQIVFTKKKRASTQVS